MRNRWKVVGAGMAIWVLSGIGVARYRSDHPKTETLEKSYLYDARQLPVSRADVKALNVRVDAEVRNGNSWRLPESGVEGGDPSGGLTADQVTLDTVRFIRYLRYQFRDAASDTEHLKKVRDHLEGLMAAGEAGAMFDLYKEFYNCENALATTARNWGIPRDLESALDMLERIRDFRRDELGVEMADAVYGAEMKAREYSLRRSQILAEEELYGSERLELLKELNLDMWGDETEVFNTPYEGYRAQMKIYERDLSEADSDTRDAMIREFRKAYFSQETIKRLEACDLEKAAEEETTAAYTATVHRINTDASLSEEEKANQIRTLQDETFGDQADAVRRRETMRNTLKELAMQNGTT